MREGVRYEVAEDLFGDLIGWCAAQIADEEKKPQPELAAVKRWTDQPRSTRRNGRRSTRPTPGDHRDSSLARK